MQESTAQRPRVLAVVLLLALAGSGVSLAAVKQLATGGFQVEHEVYVMGTPEAVFDAFTGEMMAWWDHTHSESPKQIYIEPRPGGGFYEIFDFQGNGALHATVDYADRGKRLRFTGPMGFSGMALVMVHTLDLEASENGKTRVYLTVCAVGQLKEGWAEGIDRVWHHFLVERFQPYMEKKAAKATSEEAP